MPDHDGLLTDDPAELSVLLALPEHLRVTSLLEASPHGATWHGRDRRRGADVVIKVVAPSRRASLESEARAMARVGHHPGVLGVATVGTGPEGHAWTVTDEMTGNLGELADGVEVTQLLAWGAELAAAVAHVHSLDIVHGDITPSNVLIDRAGHARLADFGAAALTGDSSAGRPNAHTPAWSAPERRAGAPPTAESDVYGLAATLLHVIPDEAAGVPRRTRRLLARSVSREPGRRPDAAEMAHKLGR